MKIFKILKIIFFVFVFGIIAYLFLLQDEKVENSPSDITQQENTKEQEIQSVDFGENGLYQYEDGSLVVSASLPSNEDGEFVKEVYDYQVGMIQNFKDAHGGIGETLETASFPWSLDLDYKQYESESIVSYVVQGYEYTGGAHGNVIVKSFNYSKDNGKLLGLDDIISDIDSLQEFSELAQQELTVEYQEGISAHEENWSVWYAHNEGITFVFQPYQIASYAVGQQEFSISAIGEYEKLFNQKYFTDKPE